MFWDVMPCQWPVVPDVSKNQSTFIFKVPGSPQGVFTFKGQAIHEGIVAP